MGQRICVDGGGCTRPERKLDRWTPVKGGGAFLADCELCGEHVLTREHVPAKRRAPRVSPARPPAAKPDPAKPARKRGRGRPAK